MKTKISLLSLTLLLISSLSATEIELQMVGGKNFPDRKKISKYDDSNTVGIRNNIYLSKNNALQLAYDRLENVQNGKDAHRYSANYMRIQRNNGSNFHPFFLVGGGYEDGIEKNQGFMNAGVGTSVRLTKNINLIGEIKGIKKNVDKDFEVNTNLGFGIVFCNEPVNKRIKCNCMLEKISPRLVQKRVVITKSDDKINCIR